MLDLKYLSAQLRTTLLETNPRQQ